MVTTNYKEIELKVGLEIHQQLNSEKKLFCDCLAELFNEVPEITFLRKLRPTQSELGQIDPAAFFEFQKGIKFSYEGNRDTSCLVEMDEEPPHDLNREALEAALIISLMLNAPPVDEIHVMRKTVIDGSTTTGFQRTCVIAFNGNVKTKVKIIPIQHIGLEEDAARKTGEDETLHIYRLDRLGIPLVEVTTAPVIHTPEEAEEVALLIGRLLRATGKVKRGIGSIRQDLNISIRDGALVEIKGVQELELVSLVVKYEVQRQLNLLRIKTELLKRGVKGEDLESTLVDVTNVFANTKCTIIRTALEKERHILAVKLPGFEGLLRKELIPRVRLGTEMADRARFWGRVGGIFHTDELPAFGVTIEEVNELKQRMNVEIGDAVVFVVANLDNASDALEAVKKRAKEALNGVPPETRAANPDGSTRYMRPRPGAARLYPETDVPSIYVSSKYVNNLRRNLPELPERKLKRLMDERGLNEKLAKQILDSKFSKLFEKAVEESQISPTFVAVTLTETLKALEREGVEIQKISDEQYLEIFSLITRGRTTKEAVPHLITWLSKNQGSTGIKAVKGLGLAMLSKAELEEIFDTLIEDNRGLLKEHKKKAFGVLMSLVMQRVRGRAKANIVSAIARKKLEEFDS
ncbi:MAG: Glu-tRNA(Gln) amidotransferase subunit GatE [Candidatus Bathyarchaeota archaeon]|nr:MAG: Glu-tRNA(Gln) amidotransferase subunit GatE [Candidatus Bathyarchaeota archaeon]